MSAGRPPYVPRVFSVFAHDGFDALGRPVQREPFTEAYINQRVRYLGAENDHGLRGHEKSKDNWIHGAIRAAERARYIRREGNGYVLCDDVKDLLGGIAVATDIHRHNPEAYSRFVAQTKKKFPSVPKRPVAQLEDELYRLRAELRALEEGRARERKRVSVQTSFAALFDGPLTPLPDAGPSSRFCPQTPVCRDSRVSPPTAGPSSFNGLNPYPTPPESDRRPPRQPTLVNLSPSPASPSPHHSSHVVAGDFDQQQQQGYMDVDVDETPSQPSFALEGRTLEARLRESEARRAEMEARLRAEETRSREHEARARECEVRQQDAEARFGESEERREAERREREEVERARGVCEARLVVEEAKNVRNVIALAEQGQQLRASHVQRAGGSAALWSAHRADDAREDRHRVEMRRAEVGRAGALAVAVVLRGENEKVGARNAELEGENGALREENGGLRGQLEDVRAGVVAWMVASAPVRALLGLAST